MEADACEPRLEEHLASRVHSEAEEEEEEEEARFLDGAADCDDSAALARRVMVRFGARPRPSRLPQNSRMAAACLLAVGALAAWHACGGSWPSHRLFQGSGAVTDYYNYNASVGANLGHTPASSEGLPVVEASMGYGDGGGDSYSAYQKAAYLEAQDLEAAGATYGTDSQAAEEATAAYQAATAESDAGAGGYYGSGASGYSAQPSAAAYQAATAESAAGAGGYYGGGHGSYGGQPPAADAAQAQVPSVQSVPAVPGTTTTPLPPGFQWTGSAQPAAPSAPAQQQDPYAYVAPVKTGSLRRSTTTYTYTVTITATSTTTTTTTPLPCGLIQKHTRYPGNDLHALPNVSSAELCCQQCAHFKGCLAWSWGSKRNATITDICYLKGGQPREWLAPVKDEAFTSGMPTQVNRSLEVAHRRPGGSIFCFALMLPSGYERKLLTMQYSKGEGIFACDEYAVYTNKTIKVATGVYTQLVNSSLVAVKGGEFGTALNTNIFLKLWGTIVLDGTFRSHDWVVKADPDTVFFPSRLRVVLRGYEEEDRGVYLNNCKMGMHGPLEVFSRNAVQTFAWGAQRCTDHFWKLCSGDCLWGEDMFIDQCLWKVLNVKRKDEDWLLTEDHCAPPPGWNSCENPRTVAFHPFKDLTQHKQCMENSMRAEAKLRAQLSGTSKAKPRAQVAHG